MTKLAEPGGEMNDATFLRQCGVEIDLRWLLEFMCEDEQAEICNHAKSLIRIADMLSRVPSSIESPQKLLR
jgi:hypothetical protein